MAVAQTISPMEAAIAAVLQRWLSVPFSLPDANCAIDLLDYAETLTGRRYAGRPSRVQVLRIARDPHGVVEIAAEALHTLGCEPIAADIARGDLAIVANAEHGPTSSLCLAAGAGAQSPMMAARGREGIEIVRIEPEFAWRVPCLRR